MDLLEKCVRSLLSVAPMVPHKEDLSREMHAVARAVERGYFTPDEEDVVRSRFAQYVQARAVLLEVLQDLRSSRARPRSGSSDDLRAFLVGFTTAMMLIRVGRFLVESFATQPMLRKKLDEAEPRFGLPANQFTVIYRSLSHPGKVYGFHRALQYAHTHEKELAELEHDAAVQDVFPLYAEEWERVEWSIGRASQRVLNNRLHRLKQHPRQQVDRALFSLMRWGGMTISDFQNPFHRKRVSASIRKKAEALLEPGDIIVTRHDDALSNLFLPGYWPHGALYMGSESQRADLGVTLSPEKVRKALDPFSVLEAKKDGVLFRPLTETLHVDAFAVLRPRLDPAERAKGLSRAATHEGKLYDFSFNFTRADRLVCTEVIYRGFHGVGPIRFDLKPHSGRMGISAEDVLDLAIDAELFDVVSVYGADGNRWVDGPTARAALQKSYRA